MKLAEMKPGAEWLTLDPINITMHWAYNQLQMCSYETIKVTIWSFLQVPNLAQIMDL